MTSSAFSLRTLIIGFVAGVLAVLVFHQIASSLINARVQWNMTPLIAPFGIPQIINQAFWGGVWGIVFALLAPRFPTGAMWWIAAVLFGAVLLPLSEKPRRPASRRYLDAAATARVVELELSWRRS